MKKKLVLMMSVLLSFGLFFAGCRNDEQKNDDVVIVSDPPLLLGGQIKKTFTNHPGSIHYDDDLKMWYINSSRNKQFGLTERHYSEGIECGFLEEGVSVIFSGDAFDFSVKRDYSTTCEYNYCLVLRDISRSCHLHPLAEPGPEIEDFFDNAITSDENMRCQFAFPESVLEEKLADTCYVINDLVQLATLYTGQKTIPKIDFDKYTLVIGRAYMPHIGESLTYHDISSEGETINLYIEAYQAGFDMIELNYFWGLYPKLGMDKLTCNRNVTKLY